MLSTFPIYEGFDYNWLAPVFHFLLDNRLDSGLSDDAHSLSGAHSLKRLMPPVMFSSPAKGHLVGHPLVRELDTSNGHRFTDDMLFFKLRRAISVFSYMSGVAQWSSVEKFK